MRSLAQVLMLPLTTPSPASSINGLHFESHDTRESKTHGGDENFYDRRKRADDKFFLTPTIFIIITLIRTTHGSCGLVFGGATKTGHTCSAPWFFPRMAAPLLSLAFCSTPCLLNSNLPPLNKPPTHQNKKGPTGISFSKSPLLRDFAKKKKD